MTKDNVVHNWSSTSNDRIGTMESITYFNGSDATLHHQQGVDFDSNEIKIHEA